MFGIRASVFKSTDVGRNEGSDRRLIFWVVEMIGKTISHYKIVEKLGEGGVGVVYKATDLHLKRTVAIKVLRTESIEDVESKKRLLREAQAAASLDHPNICMVHEIGEADGIHFIVMEYVQGKSLKEIISRERLEMRQILDIGIQIAEALSEAHEKNLIHRDIKSSNILVTDRGVVKIADFGLAKLTRVDTKSTTIEGLTKEGQLVGTIAYMSPEQALGKEVDQRSDIFSLGVVLYEMVTGRLPFDGDNAFSIRDAILRKQADPMARYRSEVPEDLERVMKKMLVKEREQRYQTVKEVAIDLRNIREEVGEEKEAEVQVEEIIKTEERHWVKLGVIGGVIALIAVALGIWFYYFPHPVLPFAERDSILIADFENRTGQDGLDRVLKELLTIKLDQSRYFNVYPSQSIGESLERMRKGAEKIDENLGREICQREGTRARIRALIVGSIDTLDGNYLLTAKIINPFTGVVVQSLTKRAKKGNEFYDKVDELSTQIRESLGEAFNSIAKNNKSLAEVTTTSLKALELYSLGLEQQNLKDKVDEAIRFYTSAIEIDPNFASAYKSLAAAYNTKHNVTEAREYARKAFELREKVTYREKFHIQALYDKLLDQYEAAINSYNLLVELYPDDIAAHGNLGLLYSILGQFDRSIEEYKEVLRINPNSALALASCAYAALSLSRYDESIRYASEALKINPQDIPAPLSLASAHLGKGELEKSRAQCEKMISSEKGLLKLWGKERLAVSHIYEGRFSAAINELLDATMISEKLTLDFESHSHRLKATLCELLGDKQRLVEDLKRVVDLSDKTEGHLGLLNLAVAGKLYARGGYLDKAVKALDRLNKKLENEQSYQSQALRDLVRGEIDYKKGNYDDAISSFRRAEAFTTQYDYLQVHESMASCYFAMKDYDQAIREYEIPINQKGRTLEYWTGLPHLWITAHYWLARAYEEKAVTDKAVANYEMFITILKNADRNIPWLEDAKRRLSTLKR